MSPGFKITIYVILVALTCLTGLMFFKNFGQLFADDPPPAEQAAAPVVTEPDPSVTDTNMPPETNEVATIDTNAPVAADTNVVVDPATTNAIPTASSAAATSDPVTAAPGEVQTASTLKKPQGRIGFWTGSFVLCVIALGGFIAWDVSNAAGNRALKVLYNDDGAGQKDPEYDEAEQMWANGQPLEAIRMMREYLNKNPREVHVALRIAEIYEKDLNNLLAAALEYEEVLKKKLEPERWGWAAIHLCNLYFKLGQEDKAYVLLQRIVRDYGETQAADKARKRLADAAPEMLAQAESGPAEEEAPKKAPRKVDDSPKQVSNLPPGFRPKK